MLYTLISILIVLIFVVFALTSARFQVLLRDLPQRLVDRKALLEKRIRGEDV